MLGPRAEDSPTRKMEPQPTARSAQRPEPGRARPGALGAGVRGCGASAPARDDAAALTVAFVSAARSGRSRSQRRHRGSCRPHARSCAPRRARRFLAPPSRLPRTPVGGATGGRGPERRGGAPAQLRGRREAPPHDGRGPPRPGRVSGTAPGWAAGPARPCESARCKMAAGVAPPPRLARTHGERPCDPGHRVYDAEVRTAHQPLAGPGPGAPTWPWRWAEALAL